MKYNLYPKLNGQTLVEWALILPVLLMLLMGVMDLGRAVYYNSVVYSAAREGARFAITSPCSNEDIENAVHQRAIATNISDIQIIRQPNQCDPASYSYPNTIKVVVTSNFVPVTPFVGAINLSSTSTMRVER
jgi:Flp pilus assembly protein TadG